MDRWASAITPNFNGKKVVVAGTMAVSLVVLLKQCQANSRQHSHGQLRKHPDGPLEIAGLRNVGNTCFLNAVLQSLASLPPFVDYLERLTSPVHHGSPPSHFTAELLGLMHGLKPMPTSLQSSNIISRKTLNPSRLQNLLVKKVQRFAGFDQQDAEELFQMVMRLVGEEAASCLADPGSYTKAREKSGVGGYRDLLNDEAKAPAPAGVPHVQQPPRNPMCGSLAYLTRCAKCRHRGPTRLEPFVDLSLALPQAKVVSGEYCGATAMTAMKPVSLRDILLDFTEEQHVDEVECLSCAIGDSERKIEVYKESIAILERARRTTNGRHITEAERAAKDNFLVRLSMEQQTQERLKRLLACSDDENEDDVSEDESSCSSDKVSGKRVGAYKRLLLSRPPETLCLHFPRRQPSACGAVMVKLEQHVDFPLRLDVSPFCMSGGDRNDDFAVEEAVEPSPPLTCHRRTRPIVDVTSQSHKATIPSEYLPSSPAKPSTSLASRARSPQPRHSSLLALRGGSDDHSRKRMEGVKAGQTNRIHAEGSGEEDGTASTSRGVLGNAGLEYDLRAVIVHHGGAEGGHYTAFRRLTVGDKEVEVENGARNGSPASKMSIATHLGIGSGDDAWVSLSDDKVKRVDVKDVLRSEAYMLFYKRRVAMAKAAAGAWASSLS